MSQGYFVTGTDTGVGKTLVSCALLRAFAAQGKSAVGMKPVAAGCEESPAGLSCEDVERLMAAGSVVTPRELVNPYAFCPSIAPHIAAAQAGIEIRLERIATAFARLRVLADVVIVEGVGGWRVPLNEREDTADMARSLGLPVILVVGMRLGCLNHALLSASAIESTGLKLAGWVANRIDPDMPAYEENRRSLENRLMAPLLGEVPHRPRPDFSVAAGCLRLNGL
jgi:dethiobiotin synthetase